MRQQVIRVDEPTPCFAPENRYAFEQVIDLSVDPKRESKDLRRAKRVAALICDGCPARAQCLEVHGDDFTLGVIGGHDDRTRREFYADSEVVA